MHLVIYFCGTRNPGDTFYDGYNYVKPGVSVSTLFVKGCDDHEVCNAICFPNLKAFAERFSKQLFHTKEERLYIASNDLERLRIGIRNDRSRLINVHESIGSITLCGYSRAR